MDPKKLNEYIQTALETAKKEVVKKSSATNGVQATHGLLDKIVTEFSKAGYALSINKFDTTDIEHLNGYSLLAGSITYTMNNGTTYGQDYTITLDNNVVTITMESPYASDPIMQLDPPDIVRNTNEYDIGEDEDIEKLVTHIAKLAGFLKAKDNLPPPATGPEQENKNSAQTSAPPPRRATRNVGPRPK